MNTHHQGFQLTQLLHFLPFWLSLFLVYLFTSVLTNARKLGQ